MLDELREIAMLPEFSAAGTGYHELAFIMARPYKSVSDALSISMRQHLHKGSVEEAHCDFVTQYQMAASVDELEVPSLLGATVGTLCRLSAMWALNQSISDMSADTDWSDWIRLMQDDHALGIRLARAIRGEIYCSFGGLILPLTLNSGENNAVWNFQGFEDAYAVRVIDAANFFEHAKTIKPADLDDLEKRWMTWEDGIGKEAQEMLALFHVGSGSWTKGYMRGSTVERQTLAALQILEIERATGPVLSADDPRLATLATEPFSGLAFVFDPEKRLLLPDPASMLNEESHHRVIQLPPRAAQ